jgi:hypothetical protein
MTSHRSTFRTRPGISRRAFVAGATATGLLAATGGVCSTAAQSIDPFTYITAMDATPEVGQRAGQPASEVEPTAAGGWYWDAYLQLPVKEGQDFSLSCEFDTAWIILMAYGFDVPVQEQLAIVGTDDPFEPYYEDNGDGTFSIYGGDIHNHFCGNIESNILAKCRSNAMRRVFESRGLGVTETPTRELIEAALLRGEPIFFKSTVDMLPWRPATWYSTTGEAWPVVLSNDHALAVMGFNADDVIIRDPLGPTSTNVARPWQWRVSWARFLEVIAAQGNDAIAIAPSPVPVSTPAG